MSDPSAESDGVVARVYDDGEHIADLTNPDLVPAFDRCGWFDVQEVCDDAA